MNPPPPPDGSNPAPPRRSFWQWLFTPPPTEPAEARADRFMARLRSTNAEIRTRAEGELRRIAFGWETYSFDAEFVVEMLRRLASTGDNNYLTYVERLAQQPARSAEQKRVRDAAHACIAALQSTQQQESTRRTLLRASSSPPSAPETLLRPAFDAPATAPAELLRAGSEQGNEPPASLLQPDTAPSQSKPV